MLTDLLTALADPSPRAANAVGLDVLAAFHAMPIGEQLRALEADLGRLGEDEIGAVIGALGPQLQQPFIPIPGPQTEARNSLADELLFGGQAGGSKSYLLVGVAAAD